VSSRLAPSTGEQINEQPVDDQPRNLTAAMNAAGENNNTLPKLLIWPHVAERQYAFEYHPTAQGSQKVLLKCVGWFIDPLVTAAIAQSHFESAVQSGGFRHLMLPVWWSSVVERLQDELCLSQLNIVWSYDNCVHWTDSNVRKAPPGWVNTVIGLVNGQARWWGRAFTDVWRREYIRRLSPELLRSVGKWCSVGDEGREPRPHPGRPSPCPQPG
jgi:hypothetical protein